jgi:4'-phosphopantetheinyl transferase
VGVRVDVPIVVDVWHLSLEDLQEANSSLFACLSDTEKQRAARFVFERDRSRFITCRGLLRAVLAQLLSLSPVEVTFNYGEKGKPHLRGSPLFFNLSHSNDQACIAACRETALGIDVECIRTPTHHTWVDLAQRFFSTAEIAELIALPASRQSEAFFACWTRKEAYLKLHGLGLALPLNRFSVTVDPDMPAMLCSTEWRPKDVDGTTLYDLPAAPLYRSSLAIASTAPVTLNHISISSLETFPFFHEV